MHLVGLLASHRKSQMNQNKTVDAIWIHFPLAGVMPKLLISQSFSVGRIDKKTILNGLNETPKAVKKIENCRKEWWIRNREFYLKG
jgi:hypothetical protein